MVKVGKYDIPTIDVDDATERLKRARTVIGSKVAKREVFAEAMGLKGIGGQTYHVISAMSMYGLIETGSNEIRITDLGELTIFGEPNEINQSKGQAVQNVELFREVYQTYGNRPTDEQLRAFLRQKAMITDLQQIPILSERIGKLLNKHLPYLTVAKTLEKPSDHKGIGGGEKLEEQITKIAGVIEIRPESGKAFVFPLDNLELAQSLANAIFEDLKKRKEHTEPN